jgi:hypothetical protein
MTFPSNTSSGFRLAAGIFILGSIAYSLSDETLPYGYRKFSTLLMFFSSIISYYNSQGKQIRFCSIGILLEDIDTNDFEKKYGYAYLIIAALYNPIFKVVTSDTFWLVADSLTIAFYMYKTLPKTTKPINKI